MIFDIFPPLSQFLALQIVSFTETNKGQGNFQDFYLTRFDKSVLRSGVGNCIGWCPLDSQDL